MVRVKFERFIRIKFILAFDLSENPNRGRELYRRTFLPIKTQVEVKNEIIEDKQDAIVSDRVVPDSWEDEVSDEEIDDNENNELSLDRQVSTFSDVSELGFDATAKESRMYLYWACDMALRQSQRASYMNSLKDDNCCQLINFLMNHRPYPHEAGNMLPALIFTFEKAVATEMATKLVDIYGVDLLKDDEKAKEEIRKTISELCEPLQSLRFQSG